MVELISENRLRYLSGLKGFNLIYLEKDYFLSLLLYLLKDVKDICFKGGTALNKIFLNHTRLSEDLDFTCRKTTESAKNEIVAILEKNKGIFQKYAFENQTNNYFRLKVFYNSYFTENSYIVIDLNGKASLHCPPQMQKVRHFYEEIPEFEILTLDPNELIAEKIRALIARNQPRDYFDVYFLLKTGHKIDFDLVGKKLNEVNQKFDVERIFKNANKIYSHWDDDVAQLTNKPVEYLTVIKRLQKEFKYKV
ncbi:MAG: nucleotidyl transferase AbiEii/AbiGii toxin family protein [Nanoarchaeota archaeon]|nr:nucleotidyl transferase AbiEii/AbiGii toxin family protein [Nanoarchaeota archaeon]MCG2723873.1 nucleotidyl transferase AbiEii/AbiGii toxin family protein [archaeon]